MHGTVACSFLQAQDAVIVSSPELADMLRVLDMDLLAKLYWSSPVGHGPGYIFNNEKDAKGRLCRTQNGDNKRTIAGLASNPDLRPLLAIIDFCMKLLRGLKMCHTGHIPRSPCVLCSEDNCSAQKLHTDFADKTVEGEPVVVLSLLIALDDEARVLVPDEHGKVVEFSLKIGDMLLFGHSFVHAGAAYTKANYRLFTYVGAWSFNPPNATNWTYVYNIFRT